MQIRNSGELYTMCTNVSIIIFKNQELQREQCEQLLSSNSIRLRSTFLMLYLKEDNVGACFTLLGTELHTFWPMYLSECFPKETVLC